MTLRALGRFFRGLFSAWALALTGVVVSLFMAIIQALPETPWPAVAFWVAAYATLMFSAWLVWRKEHGEAEKLQVELLRLKQGGSNPAGKVSVGAVLEDLYHLAKEGRHLREHDLDPDAWMNKVREYVKARFAARWVDNFAKKTKVRPNKDPKIQKRDELSEYVAWLADWQDRLKETDLSATQS